MNTLTSLVCCTPQTTLTSNPINKEKFGEFTRFAIHRTKTDAGAYVTIPVADVVDNGALVLLNAAVDETKTVFSPICSELSASVGTAIEYTAGNGNVPIKLGVTPSSEEYTFVNSRQDTANIFNSYNCTNISIIFYDSCGNAMGIADNVGTPTTLRGFPLSFLHVSPLERATIDKPNKNMVKHVFADLDWSKDARVVSFGTFKPKSDFL